MAETAGLDLKCINTIRTLSMDAVQAANSGWARYVGATGASIDMTTFGASAPLKELLKKFGFTVENVVAAAKEQMKKGEKK